MKGEKSWKQHKHEQSHKELKKYSAENKVKKIEKIINKARGIE